MREIKFRFWDAKENKWMVDGKTETNIYDFAFKPDMNWNFITKAEAIERVIVEQFIGLKDKNKKEAYHHDLIIYPDKYRNGGKPIEIIWEDGGWKGIYIETGTGEFVFDLTQMEMSQSVIIGNRCQNPKLLK